MDQRRKQSAAKSRCNQLPTGGGKSVLIRAAAYDTPSVAILAHREYLLDQLHDLVPDAQVIKAGDRWDGQSKRIIGMVQTLCRRDRDDLPKVDRIITDECHHSLAASYKKVCSNWPDAEHDGYTATPARTDGQDLDDCFDELLCGPSYRELIDGKYLKPFELYSIPSGLDAKSCRVVRGDYSRSDQNDTIRKSTIFGDVVEHWRKHCRGGGHISFWPSIEAAEHAAGQVNDWKVLHSKLPKDQIETRIKGLETGAIQSLATVDMVGEGLDLKGIQSVSLCRLTASLVNYLQWCGRSNRGGDGTAKIMDHGQNWTRHGLPDDDREWSLKGRVRKKREERGSFPVWDCPECWAVNRSEFDTCQSCGASKPREIRITEEVEARLELITKADRGDIHDLCETIDEYKQFAKAQRKPPGWAAYQWAARDLRVLNDEGNPFIQASGNQRPSKNQFMRAAWAMQLNPKYAAIYAKQIHLT